MIPAGALMLSLDQGVSLSRLNRAGVAWLVSSLILEPTIGSIDQLVAHIEELKGESWRYLSDSPALASFDLDDPVRAPEWVQFLIENQHLPEWHAARVYVQALAWPEAQDRALASWKLATARASFLVMTHLEQLVWRGYSTVGVDQLQRALAAWHGRSGSEDEDYWQSLLDENPFLINLLTTGPVVVEYQKAYVGGKGFDNRNGNIVDFVLKNSVGGNVALLEIKTPKAKLLGSTEYRSGIFPAHQDLTGAMVQVLGYRDMLLKSFHDVAHDSDLTAFDPLCIVLLGDSGAQLDTSAKRRSFELFRSSNQAVNVITYDELFARVESLLATLRGNGG